MTVLFRERKWIIMSKDRMLIVKGVPGNRYLIPTNDTKDRKRILYYNSKGMARAGFTSSGFYGEPLKNEHGQWYVSGAWREENLEAVPVIITVEEVQDGEEDNDGCKH